MSELENQVAKKQEVVVGRCGLTADRLRQLLSYNPQTGEFSWRKSRGGINRNRRAGSKNNRGYLGIRIDYRMYLCHRLAWLYIHSRWPNDQLDHINGERTDNRIVNLRECTNAENCQNVRPHRDGTKCLGVSWEKRRHKWQSGIGVNGRRIHLGYFETKEAAHTAYLSAKKLHHAFGRHASA